MNRRHLLIIILFSLVSACAENSDDRARGTEQQLDQQRITRTRLPLEVAAAAKALLTKGPLARASAASPVWGLPIHEPGSDVVALYEIDLAPGWAIITATSPEALELGEGEGPVSRMLRPSPRAARVLRLDTAIYVATDTAGLAVGQTTRSITRIDRSGREVQLVPVSADEAIALWPQARVDLARVARQDGTLETKGWGDAAPPAMTCTVPGDVPSYAQLAPGQGPNTSSCYSGCGPTAWATVFGWASRRASESASDAPFAGLYRSGAAVDGEPIVAPLAMDSQVDALSMALNGAVGTFCFAKSGATSPSSMKKASDFVETRAPEVTVDTRSSAFMTMSDKVRDAVIEVLCDGRPSIIGIGTLFGGDSHYPIAKGYDNGLFQLEMGWGGYQNGWYKAETWFLGSVHH